MKIFTKILIALKEKRFLKTTICFLLKPFLSQSSYLKVSAILDYRFGKKNICINQIKYKVNNSKSENDKITIVFVVWMVEMWNSLRSVYETALDNPKIDVYILAQPHISNVRNQKNQNPAYDFLISLYGTDRIISAFEKNEWFDLKKLNPDYVFYTYPYEYHYYELYKSEYVSTFSKICLIQYGYSFVNDSLFFVSYGFEFSKNVALQFVADETTRKKLERLYGNRQKKYPIIKNLGYPLFDLVSKCEVFENKKCILWTPRWTVPEQKFNMQSHFLVYYKKFLDFASDHLDVNIIIRPHPRMFENFLSNGLMSQEEIQEFQNVCKSMKNVELDENPDYLISVNRSSVVVSDYTALLAEYFIMNKPVIYCDSSRDFTKEGKIMDSSFYHAHSWKEIEKTLLAFLSGNDELKEKRQLLLNGFFSHNDKNSAEKILEYIEKDFFIESNYGK